MPMVTESEVQNILHTSNGYYFRTEISGTWYRRYWRKGWLMRGNAVIWVTDQGFFFRRISKIMHIPVNSIKSFSIGTEHAGKWFGGSVLKISWVNEDKELVSGFTVANDREDTERWISVMKGLTGKN